MKKLLPLLIATLVPGALLALEYENLTERYEDAPFSRAETAGISILTEVGAVSGNPDGTFAPGRTLNRAEFTKIALIAGRIQPSDASAHDTCFPDVPDGAWFEQYVCAAVEHDIVQGNPDGLFHPERAVNYAEAVKILVEVFGYELPTIKTGEDVAWYEPYLLAAKDTGVALPGNPAPGHELRRGEMARLAAAFVAESEGELDAYRAFERGQAISSSSSSVSSSSSSSSMNSSTGSSISSSSSSASSSSSVSSSSLFPALGRFLLPGATTPVLFDGVFAGSEEDAVIRLVELEFRREVRAIDSLLLVDGADTVIATLKLQKSNNDDDTKWHAELGTGSYVIPKSGQTRLGIRARVKPLGGGGTSNELVELRSFSIRATGVVSGNSRQILPADAREPVHQTAMGRILSVENDLGSSLTLTAGQGKLLGTFTVDGMAASGSSVRLESLSFTLQTSDVSLSNIKIGGTAPTQRGDCAVEYLSDRSILRCFVPEGMDDVTHSPVTLNIYGDISLAGGAQQGMVHLSSLGTGGVGSAGAVRWSDSSNVFNWIEGDAILESGPVVTVEESL